MNQPDYPPGAEQGPPEDIELAEVSKDFRPTIKAGVRLELVMGLDVTVKVCDPVLLMVPVHTGFIEYAQEEFWRHHEDDRHQFTANDIEQWIVETYMSDRALLADHVEAQADDHDGYTITHILHVMVIPEGESDGGS